MANNRPRFRPIQFPMDAVFEEGQRGFWKWNVNPYREGTDKYKEWERGFNHAYYENLKTTQ